MNTKQTVLVVEDDLFQRDLLIDILAEEYHVVAAEDGESALMLTQTLAPALILLDVEMPGMDGYACCFQFRQQDATATVPVIFISAHDKIEERLKGYEVGGNDYLVKPFEPQELKAKISYLLSVSLANCELKTMASYASSTAMTAMTSMSEMGGLLESLKKFNNSNDAKTLAEEIIAGLAAYELCGVVQIRAAEQILTITKHGNASPLEHAVISHMAGMDRITQFKTRLSIHYEHVSMIVSNMPVDDPDRCGRLRDHLAMLLEGAEARCQGIIAETESRRRGAAIEHMMGRVSAALNSIDDSQRQSRADERIAYNDLTNKMEKALMNVALTTEEEDYLAAIVSGGIEEIINVQSADVQIQNKLSLIVCEMSEIL